MSKSEDKLIKKAIRDIDPSVDDAIKKTLGNPEPMSKKITSLAVTGKYANDLFILAAQSMGESPAGATAILGTLFDKRCAAILNAYFQERLQAVSKRIKEWKDAIPSDAAAPQPLKDGWERERVALEEVERILQDESEG